MADSSTYSLGLEDEIKEEPKSSIEEGNHTGKSHALAISGSKNEYVSVRSTDDETDGLREKRKSPYVQRPEYRR